METNELAQLVGSLLILTTLLHLCMFDDYGSKVFTSLVVGVRTAIRDSYFFLIYLLFVTFVLAIIGHVLFGKCMLEFSEKTEAFLNLIVF